MAIDEKLVSKLIPSKERLTALEMRPNFPFPIVTTFIIVKNNWPFLRKIIRKSHDIIKDVFEGTSLEYKISIYKEFMPGEEEEFMLFLRRNRQKFGVRGTYGDLIFGVPNEESEKGKKTTLESINELSTRLYTGEKITITDDHVEKKLVLEKERYKIADSHLRVASLQERYEIEFEVGFKPDDADGRKLWFYCCSCKNPEFRQLYERLYKSITRCEDLLYFKRDEIKHEKFGIMRFLT